MGCDNHLYRGRSYGGRLVCRMGTSADGWRPAYPPCGVDATVVVMPPSAIRSATHRPDPVTARAVGRCIGDGKRSRTTPGRRA